MFRKLGVSGEREERNYRLLVCPLYFRPRDFAMFMSTLVSRLCASAATWCKASASCAQETEHPGCLRFASLLWLCLDGPLFSSRVVAQACVSSAFTAAPPSPPHPPPSPCCQEMLRDGLNCSFVFLEVGMLLGWSLALQHSREQILYLCTCHQQGILCAHPHVFNVHCAAPSTPGQGGVALPPGQPRCSCSHVARVTCVSIVEYCSRIFGKFRPTPIWLHSQSYLACSLISGSRKQTSLSLSHTRGLLRRRYNTYTADRQCAIVQFAHTYVGYEDCSLNFAACGGARDWCFLAVCTFPQNVFVRCYCLQ